MSTADFSAPKVTVVIPCYNHGNYLAEAIESVRAQSYPHTEIIVVDDGSTDNTKEVAKQFQDVNYVYQANQGLSAARNTGIANSTGDFLVFLDADDWLLPDALRTNLQYFEQHPDAAFISGAYKLLYVPENKIWEVKKPVPGNYYQQFLQENYIGMHATVMFARRTLEQFQYDTTLKACEDYDLYLRVAKTYPVFHHTELIAVYRIHTLNMSSNYPLMLQAAQAVLKRQKKSLTNKSQLEAVNKGIRHFKTYYTEKIYDKLIHRTMVLREKNDFTDLVTLWRYNRSLYRRYRQEEKLWMKAKGLLFKQTFKKKIKGILKH